MHRQWDWTGGEDRWVAGVICRRGRWAWTRFRTPEWLWQQLLPRGDHEIGFQELLAVILGLETLKDHMAQALCMAYIDNEGVMKAILHGGGSAAGASALIAQLWLRVAEDCTGLHGARVESKANVADGPTREEFGVLVKFH